MVRVQSACMHSIQDPSTLEYPSVPLVYPLSTPQCHPARRLHKACCASPVGRVCRMPHGAWSAVKVLACILSRIRVPFSTPPYPLRTPECHPAHRLHDGCCASMVGRVCRMPRNAWPESLPLAAHLTSPCTRRTHAAEPPLQTHPAPRAGRPEPTPPCSFFLARA